MTYQLVRVESAEQWRAMHSIRRSVLFESGIMPFIYDENRPEDRHPDNIPYLLLLDSSPIGVVRLDKDGRTGIVRLVGIALDRQRQGHGRALGKLIEEEAVRAGIVELRLNAHEGAIGFYEKTGWAEHTWDVDELSHLAPGDIQMTKKIRQNGS